MPSEEPIGPATWRAIAALARLPSVRAILRPRPPVTETRPVLWCFAAKPLADGVLTAPALVELETAAALKRHGWWIIGPCPCAEEALGAWLRNRQWEQRVDPNADEDCA